MQPESRVTIQAGPGIYRARAGPRLRDGLLRRWAAASDLGGGPDTMVDQTWWWIRPGGGSDTMVDQTMWTRDYGGSDQGGGPETMVDQTRVVNQRWRITNEHCRAGGLISPTNRPLLAR